MNNSFDVIQYLEDTGIAYKRSGKNIGKGWIGIQCPFDCGDTSYHMGIHEQSGSFHCWICGEKGHFQKLVQTIEKCSWYEANVKIRPYIISVFNDEGLDKGSNDNLTYNKKVCRLPPECVELMPMHIRYLVQRNFDPYMLIKKYNLKATYNIGYYRGRIIIPCYLDNRFVAFLGRDVTGSSNIPYLDCKQEEAIVPVKHTLYNIDRVKNKTAILVEGVTDVWRLGDGAIASFTSNMTGEQKMLLLRKGIKKLFVMYDADASTKATILAKDLSAIFDVELILLDEGDPCDLSDHEVQQIRKDLLKEG